MYFTNEKSHEIRVYLIDQNVLIKSIIHFICDQHVHIINNSLIINTQKIETEINILVLSDK